MPSFTLTPNFLAPGASPVTVTANGVGSAWTASTTFVLTGKPDATLGSVSVNAQTQTASLQITPGTLPGTLTVSDSTDAASATVDVGITRAMPKRWVPSRRSRHR